MHQLNIIHGDLTTSNLMIRDSNQSIVLIDFGLSFISSLAEDKAVDLYVLERAFLSTHPNTETLFQSILEYYASHYQQSKVVLSKLEDGLILTYLFLFLKDWYHDLIFTSSSSDLTQGIKVNHQWISVPTNILQVKLWDLNDVPQCTATIQGTSRRIDKVQFHPLTDHIVTTLGNDGKKICIWNTPKNELVYTLNQSTGFHYFDWKSDGTLLSSCGKGSIQIWDPRTTTEAIQSGPGHEGMKGSKIIWLNDSNYLFTVGANKLRNRQYALWDQRQMKTPLTMKTLDNSTGTLIPSFDPDTHTIYLLSRGDSVIHSYQISDLYSNPTITQNMSCGSPLPLFGATLLPKHSLDVMQAEVARMMCVSDKAIIPISYKVPRKSYLDFHGDLYPPTNGTVAPLTGEEWFSNKNAVVEKVSLDPSVRKNKKSEPEISQVKKQAELSNGDKKPAEVRSGEKKQVEVHSSVDREVKETRADKGSPESTPKATPESAPTIKKSPLPKIGSNHVSSYKYISAKPYPPPTQYDDLRGLSFNQSSECDLIQANKDWMIVPIAGPGGRLGRIDASKPGRLPPTLPSVSCGSEVIQFKLDPFRPSVLVTVCGDSKIKKWTLDDLECELTLEDKSMDKVRCLEFHPIAEDIIMTASFDLGHPHIRIWNMNDKKVEMQFGLPSDVYHGAWNPSGNQIAVSCKDRKIRVLDARTGTILAEGKAHDSIRLSRVVWVNDEQLVSVGFGLGSTREILFLKSDVTRLHKVSIDVSPSVMSVYCDRDCRILYTAGRGDTTIHTFEIEQDKITALPRIETSSLQQGFSFFPKRYCNVMDVEIDKLVRLTPTHIETIGIRVPRARPEYFQDDIFVPTPNIEKPGQSASDWIAGNDASLELISLQPKETTPLSEAPPPPTPAKTKFEMGKKEVSDEQRRQELMDRMFHTAKEVTGEVKSNDIPEVAEDEWDD
ncbi:hypothetical protein BDB01DRAFT_841611 [Pilobolus umbonatus]|nr:hypothetical protein BDB01DRAFT_841611 [Pilobolus umbonatus]